MAANAYAPVDATPDALAGPLLSTNVSRAVPSLRYVARTPNFSIGPDDGAENVDLPQRAAAAAGTARPVKAASDTAAAVAMVPQGGLFWDGRVNTLQDQAMGPLFNPAEMANRDLAAVATRLRGSAEYAGMFVQLFGAEVLRSPQRLVDEAMFAVARYQLEDSSFHPYTSRVRLLPRRAGDASLQTELRGLAAFEDKSRGNCAACHRDRPNPDGTPPAFTDYQYEAIGVPRNGAVAANRDPRFFDLGLCGPFRDDLAAQTQYCAMFRTPSLRNVATRSTFFHNGRYRSLDSVLTFYALRDQHPEIIYPVADGAARRFDDVPARFLGNIDLVDPPFDRKPGDRPAMTEEDRRDIVAFLKTLTDGYSPSSPKR